MGSQPGSRSNGSTSNGSRSNRRAQTPQEADPASSLHKPTRPAKSTPKSGLLGGRQHSVNHVLNWLAAVASRPSRPNVVLLTSASRKTDVREKRLLVKGTLTANTTSQKTNPPSRKPVQNDRFVSPRVVFATAECLSIEHWLIFSPRSAGGTSGKTVQIPLNCLIRGFRPADTSAMGRLSRVSHAVCCAKPATDREDIHDARHSLLFRRHAVSC